jgi:hypothetical protein
LYPETNTHEATGADDFISLSTQICGRDVERCCLTALIFMAS